MRQQVKLSLNQVLALPIEAESINPKSVFGKSADEIRRLPLWCGNREQTVGEFFDVLILTDITSNGKGAEELPEVVLSGDLTRCKRVGQGMAAGTMTVEGNVGFHAGAYMKGGTLQIHGNAGDWLGAHMEGGLIRVSGSAGHLTGTAYRGNTKGMNGGTILICGNAGQMVGGRMRRGLIAVGGDCEDMAGYNMLAGTVLICGKAGIRAGVRMERGSIIILNKPTLVPTFYYDCTYRPGYWPILCKELEKSGFTLPKAARSLAFERFSGDANEGCKGELLIGSAAAA